MTIPVTLKLNNIEIKFKNLMLFLTLWQIKKHFALKVLVFVGLLANLKIIQVKVTYVKHKTVSYFA